MKFKTGDFVLVPRKIIGEPPGVVSPFFETKINRKSGKSIWITPPDGGDDIKVATSKVRKRAGIQIFRIGDYEEQLLLDPLFKSVLQYCRILLPEDDVRGHRIRTPIELQNLLFRNHGLFEHLVLIAHGSAKGLLFGNETVTAEELSNLIAYPLDGYANQVEVISLCCETGKKEFAYPLSSANFCRAFLAPFNSVHGCVASLFCQDYLSNRILEARSTKVAARQARDRMLGAASFRLWENGVLK